MKTESIEIKDIKKIEREHYVVLIVDNLFSGKIKNNQLFRCFNRNYQGLA